MAINFPVADIAGICELQGMDFISATGLSERVMYALNCQVFFLLLVSFLLIYNLF